MKKTIGTCSRCGGAVTTPVIWHAVTPAPKTCESCGSTADYGPVIQMKPPSGNCPHCGQPNGSMLCQGSHG